mgnify:CR=1 FL=1
MERETIAGAERLPDGKYTFTVDRKPEKTLTKSGHAQRIWILGYVKNGAEKQYKFKLFPSDYKSIALALGGVKNGSDVDWDADSVEGKIFKCDLRTVKSDDGKYENYRFENCEQEIPF